MYKSHLVCTKIFIFCNCNLHTFFTSHRIYFTFEGLTSFQIKLKHDLAQSVRNHKRTSTKSHISALEVTVTPSKTSGEDDTLIQKMLEELRKTAAKTKPSKVNRHVCIGSTYIFYVHVCA
jgi:hypothetical protein